MRKERRSFYFSVEGETEKWYLDWLQEIINATETARYVVKLDSKIQKDPIARVKGMTILKKTQVTHIFDRESEADIHTKQFQTTLDRMRAAEKIGKSIEYRLGYTNFTFELWIVLHQIDCNGALAHRNQYLAALNRAYHESFENLEEYKHSENFHRLLSQLTLDHVRHAVTRAKAIMQHNAAAGYTLHKYRKFEFYKENPALSLGDVVGEILHTCALL